MKFNFYRILTIVMAVVLVFAVAVSVAAVNKKTATQDGLYVVFTTDKDEYAADETVKVNLQIINNAAAKVDLQSQITFPNSIQVAAGSAEQTASIEVGSVWDADELTLKYEKVAASAENGGGWLVAAIIGGVVVVAAVVLLLIFGKNLKSHVSILLLFAMVASMVVMAIPAKAEPVSSSLDVVNQITVDNEPIELKATITYTIAEVQQDEEEIDDGRLVAFYYNDFEDPDRWIQDGATLNYGDNQVIDSAAEADGKNHYGYIEIKNSSSAAYVQADLKESRPVEHMVVRMELSTGSFVPKNSYVQYRYNASTNQMLLYITEDGKIRIGKTVYDDVRVEKDKWLKIEFVIDFTDPNKDVAQVYVNDEKLTDLELLKSEKNYPIPYVRFTVAGQDSTGASVGGSLWLDNIAVYEGAERLPMDQMKSPKLPTGERRTIAPDEEMIHPELTDLGEGAIAVLAGSVKAYVGGMIELSSAAEAVMEEQTIIDVKVPGAFLKQYLGVSGLDDSQMYSLKEHAGDKNVLIDSRGLVVLSTKQLDADADVKLLTMVYGYLKTGELVNNYAIAPVFTQTVIDEAFTTIDAGFGPYSSTSTHSMKNMNAIYYLTLAARLDENAAASDGSLCKDEAISRIKRLVSGGREPNATVGCFWEQSIVGSIMLLAKNTPCIWNNLTAEEHGKIDLLMECLAIASNWGHNAGNDYRTGFDLLGNYGKDYNPNFKNASFVNYLSASMYFGAEKLDEIYTSFDYDKYIERLKKAGFTNIIAQWTNKDLFGVSVGEYMTYGGEVLFEGDGVPAAAIPGESAGSGVGVKVPWQYQDLQTKEMYDRDDWYPMLFDHIDYTYGLAVISTNGIPGSMTYSYIMSGKTSPHAGKMGMLMEFSSIDGGGYTRSKCMYCYLSVQVMVSLYANIKLLGFWDYDSQTPEVAKRMREMDNRMMVGNEDLFFKLQEGYMGNSQQKSAEEHAEEFVQFGLKFVEDIWYNFHAMDNESVDIVEKEEIKQLQDAAPSKDGVTDAPEGAWIPMDSDSSGYMHNEAEYVIDGKCYQTGTLEFDLTIGDEMQEVFNGVIMFGQHNFGLTNYSDHSMLIALKAGDIYVYNEDEYAATGIKFGPNYKFHFKVDFNCTTKRYDVTVTQTWPKTDKTVSATVKDMWFRNTYAVKYVDMFQMNSQAMMDEFWVENVKISGTTRAQTPYTPYRELSVKLDWGEVPANKRPASVKVNLVYNGKTIQHKYVILTQKNGWTASFDHILKEINKREAGYSVYLEPVAGYLAVASEIDKNNVITVVQTTRPVIYDNDFQDGTLGKMTDNSGPYDRGTAQIVTEGNNKFLTLNDPNNLEHQMGLVVDGMFIDGKLNELYSMIFFEMDIKKAQKDSMVGGYALGYRQARTDGNPGTASHNLVSIVKNSIRVLNSEKAYTIGDLTDEWQHLKVCLDIENQRALIFYGSDTNFILIEDLPEVVSNSFHISTWINQHGLAVDNMKVYCDASLTLNGILDSMKTELTVQKIWSDDVAASKIPDSIKAYLVVNGEVTDKYVTLTKADGWAAKSFEGLNILVNGHRQSYSAMLEYVPKVVTSKTVSGNSVIFTSFDEFVYYDNDFTEQKFEAVDVSHNVLDKAGNVLLMSTGTPTFTGNNPYWVYTDSTSSVANAVMQDARNVMLSMKLKAETMANGGMFSVRYRSGDDTRKVILEATCKDNVVTVKFFERVVATMTAGQWLNIQFMFDKENNICRVKIDDGQWVEAQGCAENTGDYIRFYANAAMQWGIDDLKIYSDGSWTAEEVAEKIDVTTSVDWADGTPGKSSLTMQLYCNGAAVSGKTLTLRASNNWSGTFKDLPTRDTFGNALSYTVKQVETLSGYNTYYTGGGTILHHTKNTYYYWNDFTNKTMTDDNGAAPGVTGPISFLGTENVYAGYRGSFGLTNDSIKTAKNIMISMKLRVEELAKGALFSLRYKTAEDARYPLFEISINSTGTNASMKLAGTQVMAVEAQKWYDLTIAYDQQRNKAVLYCNGELVGDPVECVANIGDSIMLYANNIDWQMDDFRIYTDKEWSLKAMEEALENATTTVTVEKVWASDVKADVIPDSIKAYLVVNGEVTDKYVTLRKADGWAAKSFTDLKVRVNGEKQNYSVTLAYLPKVVTAKTVSENKVTFTSYGSYTYYDNDFKTQKVEAVDVSHNVLDKAGNVLLMSTGTPTFTGSNPYWVYTDSTSTVANAVMQDARNVMLSMKLKAETMANGGMFSVRYRSGDDTRKVILEATCKDNVVTVKFFERVVATMTAGQWLDITVMFDKENNICRVKIDDGQWVEAQGCAENTGDYIRFYANAAMQWGIDDLKIYSDGNWTAEEVAEKIDVTTSVDWTDGTPGKSSLTMQLYRNGAAVSGKTLTLSASNNWSGTFKDLPTRDTFGNALSYTVKQVETLSGYNTYYTGGGTILHHTKNTYYYWNDFTNKSMTDDNGAAPGVTGPISFLGTENVYAGYRGSFGLANDSFKTAKNIMISMKLRIDAGASGVLYSMRYVSADNVNYPIFEVKVNSAGTDAWVELAGTRIMNFNAERWYDFTVAYDQQNDKIVLYCDGQIVGSVLTCAHNIGNVIKLYANNIDWQMDDFCIYTDNAWNCYGDFKTEVGTTLTWDDLDNADNKRPESVTVTLFADGVSTGKTAVLNAANEWKATFADLPKYDVQTGNEVVYTVTTGAANYTATYDGTAITMHIDLSNKLFDKTVTVNWDDKNDTANRPAQLTLQLYADGVAVSGKTLTVNETEGWTATFKDLPLGDTYGRRYVYTVKQVETLSGYELYYTGAGEILNYSKYTNYYWNDFTNESMTDDNGVVPGTATGPYGYAQKDNNTYLCYRQSFGLVNDAFQTAQNIIVSMKLRIGAGAQGALYSLRYVSADNVNYPFFQVRVNGAGTDAWVELAGTRVMNFSAERWYDFTIAFDQQNDKIVLYCDGRVVGTLLSCADNIGNAIKLYGSGTDWQMDDFRIYTDSAWNCYSDFKTEVETTLTWDDLDNADGNRPESVTVTLLADGVSTGKTAVLNAANQWKATFADLPKYNAQTGNETVFTVAVAVTGYTATYSGTAITMNIDLSDKLFDKTVTVNWDDKNDAANRPAQLTLQLYADGVAVEGKTLTVNETEGWAVTFKDLPLGDVFGRRFNYTVKQVETLSGYELYYTGAGEILNYSKNTNYYWNDFTNESMTDDNGVAPSITDVINFAGQGNVYAGYRGTFALTNDSIKTASNIILSVKLRIEAGVSGAMYSLRYISADNNNYPIFQVRVNGAGTDAWVELAGTRVMNFGAERWYDFTIAYDQEHDKVLLYCNGQLVGSMMTCAHNTGNLIKLYANSTDWQMDDFRIYTDSAWNCYSDFKTEVETTLTWEEMAGESAQKPDSVTVNLLADGVATGKTVVLSDANQWKATFADLPEYNEQTGEKAVYTVSAEAAGYIAAYTGTAITMQMDLSGITVDKSVTVEWDDEDDVANRPNELTVQLYADGTAVDGKTQKVNQSNSWAAVFSQLVKYNLQTRIPYEYTISVVRVPGYMAMYQNDKIVMVKGISFDIRLIDGTGMGAIAD